MTLKKALTIVTRLLLKRQWREAGTISVPLVLACFFVLTGLSDETP